MSYLFIIFVSTIKTNTIMKQVRIYPFNERGVVENVKGSVPYIIAEKLNNGIKLAAGDLMYITEQVNGNSFFKDSIPLQGVRFDFSDFLKTYVVKQYGNWREYKAVNKTTLRKCIYGTIEKIVEVV